MIHSFFYWSGVLAWIILTPGLIVLLSFVFYYWWSQIFLPSIGNLLFVFFGLRKCTIVWFYTKDFKDLTYYDLWKRITGWEYRFFTKGDGKRNFGRLAMASLIRRARKQYRREFKINKRGNEIIKKITPTDYLFQIGDRIRLKGNHEDTVGHSIVNIQEGCYWCDGDITIPVSKGTLYESF